MCCKMLQILRIERPVDPPNPSIHIDLLWADPDKWVRGWQQNTRGVSYVFGADIVNSFCQQMDIDLVARFCIFVLYSRKNKKKKDVNITRSTNEAPIKV